MATVVINDLILKAARAVQEYRASAGAAGDSASFRFTSTNWTDYVNRSVREYLSTELERLGTEGFRKKYPEYEKPSGTLTLVSGSVAKPSDALVVVDLLKSDNSVGFDKVDKEKLRSILTSRNPLIVPSAARPVFWEEEGNIKTLGLTSGNVIARYIKTHTDVVVVTGTAGAGKKNTAAGQYTNSTKVLKATMSSAFTTADIGRRVMFFETDFNNVYFVRISNYKAADEVYITGINNDDSGLPGSDLSAGSVTILLMEQAANEDVVLNKMWHDEIVKRMVAYAMADWEASQLK